MIHFGGTKKETATRSILMVVGVAKIAPIFQEPRKLEAALCQSDEQFRTAFENTALGIEATLEEIGCHRVTKCDRDVLDACLRLYRERGYRALSRRGDCELRR